jgi:hypothetical protein
MRIFAAYIYIIMKPCLSRILPAFCLALVCLSFASAQNTSPSLSTEPQKPDNFWRRVTIGGYLGFQFGQVTGINIAPEASIRTVDNLYTGFRFIYQYYNYKDYFYDSHANSYISYKSNVAGGAIYLRYYFASLFSNNILKNLFAHAEYEYTTYSRPYKNTPGGYILDPYLVTYVPGNERIRINSIFVGGGYHQPVSSRVALDLLLLFNLNDTYNSPYDNPIFRMGVGVGL